MILCDARRRPAPRGVALFAAVATLMLVALLVAGGLSAVNRSQLSASSEKSAALLYASAEGALSDVLAGWNEHDLDTLAAGATTIVSWSDDSGMRATVTITALQRSVYWLVAAAWSASDPRVFRRVNVIAAAPQSGAVVLNSQVRPVSSRAWAQLFEPP